MGWVSGPDKMEEDVELEEGEAGYFKSNDDRSIDPDISLSYIDEKLQSVLGHFQKDFEGGVSAENLGAKFGGYGSFLPMYQHSPSIWSLPKSPHRVQTKITQSPDRSHKEGAARSSSSIPDATSCQRDGTAAPHIMCSLHDEKVSLGNDLLRKNPDLSSDRVDEKLSLRHQPSPKKSFNSADQKTLKFRIKVSSDKAAQKNAAIYSGLGLISPSSSPGNSPGGSGGIPFESRENPDKSPTRILQVLSTLTVSLGQILSPLPERFMNLLTDIPLEGKSMPALMDKLDHPARFGNDSYSKVGDQDIYKGKKNSTARKREAVKEDAILLRIKEDSGAEVPDSRQCGSVDESPKYKSDSVDNTGGSLRNSSNALDTLREAEKGTLTKSRKLINNTIKGRLFGADVVKDNPFELVSGQGGSKLEHQEARSSSVGNVVIKDSPINFPENRRNKANGVSSSLKIESDISESDRDSKGAADHLLPKGGPRVALDKQDKSKMPNYKKKFPSEGKKKHKISQFNGKISSDSLDDGRMAGLSVTTKEKRSSKKDTSMARELYEDLFGYSEVSGCPVDPLEKPSSDGSKGSTDTVKDERRQRDRVKVKSSRIKVNNQHSSESLLKDPLNYNLPPTNGLPLEMEQKIGAVEQLTAPPLYIEDWVCCDRCQKWRLLPYGRTPDQLPEKWVCTMLDWLPGMNSCDIIEDKTTDALRSSYQLPFPTDQKSGPCHHANRAATGVSSVDAYYSNLGNPNVSSYNIANGITKKHKVKETSQKGSKPSLNMTSAPRNLEQGLVRKEILNDKKRPDSGVKLINSFVQHRSSSDNVVEKHSTNQKLEHATGGEAKLKRSSKRASDQYEHPTAKKVKTGRTSDIVNSPPSAGSLGRTEFGSTTILPTVAPVKDKQKSDGRSWSKDSKSEEGIVSQPSARRLKEEMMDSNVGGLFDTRHPGDNHMSLKKRKLMDWQNSQNNVEAMKNGHPLSHNKVPVGEKSDKGLRKNKTQVSQTDGTVFGGTKGNDEVTQQGIKSRTHSSGVKDPRVDKGIDKEKQSREFKIKVTSQLTMEDLESLKKDLASEQLSAAATSSSSKVSDSHKIRVRYSENGDSPVESVSSSPLRMSTLNKLSPLKVESLVHDDVNLPDNTQQSGKARARKPQGTGYTESFNNFGNGCLDGNHPGKLEGHGMCLTEEPHSEPHYDKDQSNKKHYTVSLHRKNGKASSVLPKDKERTHNYKQPPEKVSPPRDRHRISNPKKNAGVVVEVGQNQAARSAEELGDVNHQKSTYRSVKSNKVASRASKMHVDETRENRSKCGEHENQDFLSENLSKVVPVVDCGNEKPQLNQYPQAKNDLPPTSVMVSAEDQKKDALPVQPHDVSWCGELSRESKDSRNAVHKSESLQGCVRSGTDGPVAKDPSGPSFLRGNCSQSASAALKEAEGFRDYADRLKDTGFGYECNETYFQAALKFLLGASLMERHNESCKRGEMNQMQIYISSAKLCETCAEEYERRQEMAAAALAYKCMEVAYMRVVYFKNVTANRLCHDLQASLQMVPQGESPSSSASDIDNLNNHALVDKSSKSNGTHFGNHILAPRSRPSFARLLDFTKDVNSAMEASRKSQDALAAANMILDEAQNKEGIVSVKRVIDFSFQDVEELVRLVVLAKEAINRKPFCGNRN